MLLIWLEILGLSAAEMSKGVDGQQFPSCLKDRAADVAIISP